MINIKKIFNGGINADDDIRLLEDNQILNAENCRVGISEYSKNFSLNNIPSTELVYDISLPYENICIGRVSDQNRKRVIWFVYNSNGLDGIYAYDIQLDLTYIVLLSSQTEEGLNFDKDYRISKNARVVSDLLTWTDNNNEPQCISIEAGIKLNQPSYVTTVDPYATDIEYTTLTLIKRPPVYKLQVTKINDTGFDNNFIAENAYQFSYRYQYKNYQYSALSALSQLIPYNSAEDLYNAVNVKVPFSEHIDDYIQALEIVVRYGNYGKSFIIRRYDKRNYYDAVAISDHNANVTQLGFTFYDNTTGIALDDVTANTSFHNVALQADTLELARNRLFLGNVLKGYDTPSISSLDAVVGTIDTGGAGTYTSEWKYFNLAYYYPPSHTIFLYQYYYAYNESLTPKCYLYNAHQGVVPPATLNAIDADIQMYDETAMAIFVRGSYAPPPGALWDFTYTPTFATDGYTTDLIVTTDLGNVQFFKSSSLAKVSLAFFDRFRRKCGVVTNDVEVSIPQRTATQTVFSSNIGWTLNNINALDEIPDWAYYYQIHVNKNLTTRNFIQFYINDTDYIVKNQDGTYDYGNTTFALNTTYAVGFNLTPLTSAGLGYTYTEGDLLRVYKTDGTNVLLTVLGQDGNFVFATATDLGTLGIGTGFLIELYTPYKPSTTENYFETGDVIPINNPATSSREYSILSGTINGDCYAIERDNGSSLYFVEAMSPNDKVWSIWQTDTGWVNQVDTIGQQRKDTAGDYSNTYINGTKTNGLNIFEPLSTFDLGSETGAIRKLQLTNKMQELGTIMLAICEAAPISIYLGETQVVSSIENTFIAVSDGVVGTKNALKNGFGTIHPESVVEYNGTVWWWDGIHGVMCQYDSNGVAPISEYKMRRFFDRYGKRYLEQGAAGVEALCGFSYIEGGYDPSTGEVLFTLPQVETNNVISGIPTGFAQPLPSYSTLPSYATSIQNRFDIYDGQSKTLSFKNAENTWQTAYQWLPDCLEYFGNKLFGFKNGNLYLHNENTASYNNIYGVNYPQRICFVASVAPSVIADLFDIAIEGNGKIPNFSVAYTLLPNEQITDLVSGDYINKEGVYYIEWKRDRLSPNVSGSVVQKLLNGDFIKSNAVMIMLEFTEYDSQLIINFVNIGVDVSRGHSQIISNPKK